MFIDIYNIRNEKSKVLIVPKGNELDKLPTEVINNVGVTKYWKTIEIEENENYLGLDPQKVISELKEKGYSSGGIKIDFNELI